MENTHDNKKCIFCDGHGKHILIRWILGIAILVIVFSIGIKLGELAGFVKQSYYGYGQGCGSMMQGYYGSPRGMMWSDYYGR